MLYTMDTFLFFAILSGIAINIENYYIKSMSLRFITSLVLSCAFLGAAQEYSGTVINQANGKPVEGVWVSAGYSEFYTRTDENGNFTLSNTTPIKPAGTSSKMDIVKVQLNIRRHTLDLNSAPWANSAAIYALNGKMVFKGQVPPSKVIELPSLAMGIYLLELRGENGLRSSVRSAKPAQAFSSLIFRHDNYYPKDISIASSGVNMRVSLKPDDRSFVFDQSKVREYSFTINSADSLYLDTQGWKEEYVQADMSFEGKSYGTVGIRYKGSEYSLPRCFDATGRICPKISYKVKFTEYDKDKRFYGMKKINLHAMAGDNTKMRDMLAYELYREMGIHAPRTSYVNVYVNGNLAGLFLAVEEIDGRFTKSRWPDYGDGNLYKEKWPTSASASHYMNGLKTNDSPEDNPNVQKMVSYYNAIQASNEQTFEQNLSPYMDFYHFLRYMAVDVAINNWDGIRSWYSDQTALRWASNHNYFFYEEENTGGKIWLVPWDMDNTFWEIDPYYETAKVPQWNETPAHCGGYPTWNDEFIRPPNCDKLTKLMAAVFWNNFTKLGEQFLKYQFASQRLINKINTHVQVISEFVQRDPVINNTSWTNEVGTLKYYIPNLATKFSNHIHSIKSEINSSRYLNPMQLNSFEFKLAESNMYWVQKYFSDNSEGSVTYNTANPLYGTADMRFDFTFKETNNPKTWDVWGNFQPEFEKPADFSNLKEIRIALRSDKARNWRISLGNWDVYQKYGASSEYGWEMQIAAQTQTVTLKMSEIAFPSWASSKPDIKAEVLKSVRTLMFSPSAQCNSEGFLKIIPDIGYLQVDNIEFVY
ncbi:hypothetical protein R83H12_02252 [Fibrobacteria bacterium R8-3-H12]